MKLVNITIKGNEEQAQEALNKRNITQFVIESYSVRLNCTILYAMVEDDSIIYNWANETITAPFPPGTLMHWKF